MLISSKEYTRDFIILAQLFGVSLNFLKRHFLTFREIWKKLRNFQNIRKKSQKIIFAEIPFF